MTMVNGVGAWVGSILSGMAVDYFSVDGVKDWHTIWLMLDVYKRQRHIFHDTENSGIWRCSASQSCFQLFSQ